MSYLRDPFAAHTGAVDTLAAPGIAPPREWIALRDRFNSFIRIEQPCLTRLAEEIVTPTGGDVDALRALALAEQTSQSGDIAAITATVRASVHSRLLRLYERAAKKNYKTAADRFDAAATVFQKAAQAVDPEADSDHVVRLDERLRQSWLSAAVSAAELDETLPILAAAATLAGADDTVTFPGPDAAGLQLSLTVETAKLHRRRMWEAWQSTGRCGNWSAVHKLGARIRAATRPEKLEEYAQPRPLIVKSKPGKHGGHERYFIDPEDNPNATPEPAAEWSA